MKAGFKRRKIYKKDEKKSFRDDSAKSVERYKEIYNREERQKGWRERKRLREVHREEKSTRASCHADVSLRGAFKRSIQYMKRQRDKREI